MSFSPSLLELLNRARADLRSGVPVVLGTSIVCAAETVSSDRMKALLEIGDHPYLAITRWRAETLKIRVYDTDLARVGIPSDARLSWLQSLADPADDLNSPMKGPFNVLRNGDPTDARLALSLLKDARLLPAALMIRLADPIAFANNNTLVRLPNDGSIRALFDRPVSLLSVVNAHVPLSVNEQARLHVYRPADGGEEHYAIEIGKPSRSGAVLARLHSACFTGDLLGSLKCDCGPQLRGALSQMGHEGDGLLLYLNQEGRGIGLANKMRAYSLQDQGFDTVEANHRLGFEDDERDFRIGSEILKTLGFSKVRLLTNNPGKIEMMRSQGIDVVERVPLQVGRTQHNEEYLRIKASKSGHLL